MDETTPKPPTLSLDEAVTLEELTAEAQRYVAAAKAPATRKAYQSDWSDFVAWCARYSRTALPASADTVALYLTHSARRLKTSTLERRLVSIAVTHRDAGKGNPVTDQAVRSVWDGIRREKGVAKERKNPALTKLIRKMVAALPDALLGQRDRAIILLGYAGALRRSEIVGLDFDDISFVEEGLIVTLKKSKTDQNARGRRIGIPFGHFETTCPVRAVSQWLAVSGISEGPLFRSVNRHSQVQPGRLGAKVVATIVKRTLTAIGLESKNFAGHSLRSGFATMAALEGGTEREIQKQTGHKDLLVLRRYIHDGELFRRNAARRLGL